MNSGATGGQKCYCIAVSLGAKVLVSDYFAKLRHYSDQNHIRIECCLLDVPEVANMQYLTELNENQMLKLVEKQVGNMKEVIKSEFPEAVITQWSDYRSNTEFQKCLHQVEDEYRSNKAFRNHCHSQTFSNLKPVLRTKGIVKKGHPTVALLSGYLTRELALLLYLEQRGSIEGFIAPKAEMEIQTALANGKYPRLAELAGKHKATIIV